MKKIKVLLADDHKLVREAWAFMLSNDTRFEVAGAASTGDEAVELANTLNPDIVLMDINMGNVSGFEATRKIKNNSPATKVIGVSMHSIPAYVKKMLKLGAKGYVTKNSDKDELIHSIIEVHQGKTYICEEIRNIIARHELDGNQDGTPNINLLSQRELEIVQQIKNGFSSKEIAGNLGVSIKTIEVHRYNILKKLNLRNSAVLINFINTHGI